MIRPTPRSFLFERHVEEVLGLCQTCCHTTVVPNLRPSTIPCPALCLVRLHSAPCMNPYQVTGIIEGSRLRKKKKKRSFQIVRTIDDFCETRCWRKKYALQQRRSYCSCKTAGGRESHRSLARDPPQAWRPCLARVSATS